ncbi:MAG: hypothetical protein COA52_11525 [Hyphomicrobiales bacterium]|nr:MAG: hypothetical protein COA52_11525 [Hyphomicrobiales bacterium]
MAKVRIKYIVVAVLSLSLLALSWSFFVALSALISELWRGRPATVIGLAMIIIPIFLAFPIHYFLNIRRTSTSGVILVNSFYDYVGHGLLNLTARLTLTGSIFAGVFILLFGFDIR